MICPPTFSQWGRASVKRAVTEKVLGNTRLTAGLIILSSQEDSYFDLFSNRTFVLKKPRKLHGEMRSIIYFMDSSMYYMERCKCF